MRVDSKHAIAVHLRSAIWAWIDVFPSEFNETIRARGKTEGALERVFDLLFSAGQAGSERVLWPTLTALYCISSDRISREFQHGRNPTRTSRKVLILKLSISPLLWRMNLFFCTTGTQVD